MKADLHNQTNLSGSERIAFSLRETAGMLGISYSSDYRLWQRGLLRSSKALRRKLIPADEIERFLRET